MKTDIQVIANLVAGVIWADGTYDPAEKVTVAEIAEALEYNTVKFEATVEQALGSIKDYDEERLNSFIAEEANKVVDEEIGIALEAIIQIATCDGVLALEEVEIIHTVGDALGVSSAMVTMLVADMVQSEPDLEIAFED